MYRITAPRTQPHDASRPLPRAVLTVLAVLALALLSYYVHVLQDQVQRARVFRAQLQQSGPPLAIAKAPRGGAQLVASQR